MARLARWYFGVWSLPRLTARTTHSSRLPASKSFHLNASSSGRTQVTAVSQTAVLTGSFSRSVRWDEKVDPITAGVKLAVIDAL
jgi:ferric iron reductase protein FhuF